jgi:hypothetical protein
MTTFETLEEEEWDIDECRGDHESDEHWELRRNFLSTNKGRFLKLRLLSLSQVFVNVEFLGCKYVFPLIKFISQQLINLL